MPVLLETSAEFKKQKQAIEIVWIGDQNSDDLYRNVYLPPFIFMFLFWRVKYNILLEKYIFIVFSG